MTPEELEQVRKAMGWNIHTLAEKCGVGSITAQKMLAGKRPVPQPLAHWLLWLAATVRSNPAPDFQRQANQSSRGRATEVEDYRAVAIPTGPTAVKLKAEQRCKITAPLRHQTSAPPAASHLAAGRAPPPPPAPPPNDVAVSLARLEVERARLLQDKALWRGPRW
jgi:hypothetical protein